MAATRTVSIYLLKSEIDSARAALRGGGEGLDVHEVAVGETSGTLFVQEGEDTPPEWALFLEGATQPPLAVQTRSARAILILEAAGRRFAITFGQARHLLDPEAYVHDFGLLCALNAVDPERLRGAEARTFDEYALHTLRQISRVSSLESLELNTDRELVVSLAGQLEDSDLGRKVDGRHAARITAELDVSELESKCAELLGVSEMTKYRTRFPFFDTIKRVSDPTEIARLESKAFAALGKRDFKGFDLFPPQIVSAEIVAFQILPIAKGTTTVAEPGIPLLRFPLPAPTSPAQAQAALRHFRIRGIDANNDPVDEWTFLECLHWEFKESGTVHVLDSGQWYRIDRKLSDDVEAFAGKLKPSGLQWMPAVVKQPEGDYNEKAARSVPGTACLDKHLVRLPGQSGIEACDIFSDRRLFVHVKHRKGGSGPLSHLFAQALVSAECFVTEPEFRRLFKIKLEKARKGFGKFSPEEVNPRDYGIVLALIMTPTAGLDVAKELPFFSKVTLRLAVKRLESMGFDVFVDAIPTGLSPDETKPKRRQPPKLPPLKIPKGPATPAGKRAPAKSNASARRRAVAAKPARGGSGRLALSRASTPSTTVGSSFLTSKSQTRRTLQPSAASSASTRRSRSMFLAIFSSQ